MKSTNPRAPFFVMAHHRSGSNFLNDLLQTHPRIECLNEPLSMHTRFFRERDLALWQAGDFDPALLHESLAGEPALRAYLVEMRQYLQHSHSGRIIGFKDTCLFGKLGWLQAFMPSLKVIFLRRDPHAIVSSVLRSELAGFWRYAELVPPAFALVCPGYASRVDRDEPTALAAELVAMSVAARYELARRTLDLFAHLTLDLDELMRTPLHGLQAVADFLGIEPDPQQMSFIITRQGESRGGLFSSFRDPVAVEGAWRTHLSARQVEAIDDVMQAMRRTSTRGSFMEVGSS
jgi:hypothetical protein